MIPAEEIVTKIREALPDAVVHLEDLTGGQDHWSAVVVSASFEGKSRLARHRMVHEPLAEDLKGRLHALTMKTYTPEQAAEAGVS